MNEIIRSLNWLGIFTASLFLWLVRFGLSRVPRLGVGDKSKGSLISSTGLGHVATGIICVVIATCLGVVLNERTRTLSEAIGIGVVLSLIPAAVLVGMGISAPEKHGTIRAAAVIVSIATAAAIVHSVAL